MSWNQAHQLCPSYPKENPLPTPLWTITPKEPPLHKTPGESHYAIQSPQPWNGKDRTKPVFGLVVHTTGAGLPARARRNGVAVTTQAVRWYQKSHGTHYVIGYRGIDGDLIQVANERERAGGVGTKKTRDALKAGDWTAGLPKAFVKHWHGRWNGVADNPTDLFPGTNANNVYVHCEMPPCVFYDGSRKVTAAVPMDRGFCGHNGRDLTKLRFTAAQHDAIVYLACDLARRYEWPDRWWQSGRLVGHEDLAPHDRTHKFGGWDPGWLRNSPYFDFDYVLSEIGAMY